MNLLWYAITITVFLYSPLSEGLYVVTFQNLISVIYCCLSEEQYNTGSGPRNMHMVFTNK